MDGELAQVVGQFGCPRRLIVFGEVGYPNSATCLRDPVRVSEPSSRVARRAMNLLQRTPERDSPASEKPVSLLDAAARSLGPDPTAALPRYDETLSLEPRN
jgi:hypothetical protein